MALTTIKGPAIFLAQYAGDSPPFNSLDSICKWAAGLGFKGVQMPSWDARLFDLKKAAASKGYCDDVKGTEDQCRPKQGNQVPQDKAVHRDAIDEAVDAGNHGATILLRPAVMVPMPFMSMA